jgi:hypothetical protein
MKLILPLITVFMSAIIATAQTPTDLFFSEYVEGSGNNKGLEIYNPTNKTIDLSSYIVVRFSNGESYPSNLDPKTTAGGYLLLKGTLAPGKCHVIVNGQTVDADGSPACSPEMQKLATQLDNLYPAPTYMNGNDAIGLLKLVNGNYLAVDIFGQIGIGNAMKNGYGWSYVKDSTVTYKSGDVSVTAQISNYIVPLTANDGATFGPFWMAWSKDHSLIRKPNIVKGVVANPNPFKITAEWDTLPAVNKGDTAWSYEDIWTNLGIHECVAHPTSNTEVIEDASISIYPNPCNSGNFSISSHKAIIEIEVYSAIGQSVLKQSFKNEKMLVDIQTTTLNKGMYLVKVILSDKSTSVRKVMVN